MPYVDLDLPDGLPRNVELFIRRNVESDYLADAHRLLATTFPGSETRGQVQRPIALTLLATIGGVSKVLYSRDGEKKDGVLFRGCIVDFYPSDLDPPQGVTLEAAAEIIYGVVRCPLVHSLGSDARDALPPEFRKATGHVVKLGRAFRGTADADARVEALERSATKYHSQSWLTVEGNMGCCRFC